MNDSKHGDREVRQLAALALANSFYKQYSVLAQTYLNAAAGLDVDAVEERICNMSNPYSMATITDAPLLLIEVRDANGVITSCPNLASALASKDAVEILVAGDKVFEMGAIGWFFTGE